MDSSSALAADPYLWTGIAALFLGLSLGQALRAFLPFPAESARREGRRAARLSRSVVFLAFSLLSLTALFIFCAKGFPALDTGLLVWLALLFAAGSGSAILPPVLAPLFLLLFASSFLLLCFCIQGWLPLPRLPSATEIASLLPYESTATSFHGQLDLPEHDSVPVSQELSLASSSISLRVEVLSFSGPLRLLAALSQSLMLPASEPASLPSTFPPPQTPGSSKTAEILRLYRVCGLSGPGLKTLEFSKPIHENLLDVALGLGQRDSRSILFGLIRRQSLHSEAANLLTLVPLKFSLNADASAVLSE